RPGPPGRRPPVVRPGRPRPPGRTGRHRPTPLPRELRSPPVLPPVRTPQPAAGAPARPSCAIARPGGRAPGPWRTLEGESGRDAAFSKLTHRGPAGPFPLTGRRPGGLLYRLFDQRDLVA